MREVVDDVGAGEEDGGDVGFRDEEEGSRRRQRGRGSGGRGDGERELDEVVDEAEGLVDAAGESAEEDYVVDLGLGVGVRVGDVGVSGVRSGTGWGEDIRPDPSQGFRQIGAVLIRIVDDGHAM